jgi:hypothetical protein
MALLSFCCTDKLRVVKAGTRKNKKQAAEAAATAAAYRAAVESSMAASLGDDSHLIHKPTKHGLGVSELTGAMSVADAMQIPNVNGASPSVVSLGEAAGGCGHGRAVGLGCA